jgi:hypothetical protein
METQEVKTIRRSRTIDTENTSPKSENPLITHIKTTGVALKRVVLQDVVVSWTGEPERAFYSDKSKPSRIGKIWYTPEGMVIEQSKGHQILLPVTMVKYAFPL